MRVNEIWVDNNFVRNEGAIIFEFLLIAPILFALSKCFSKKSVLFRKLILMFIRLSTPSIFFTFLQFKQLN